MERDAAFLAAASHAATGQPMSSTRAYMLVGGLALTLRRAVERGDDLDAIGAEINEILRIVGAAIQAEAGGHLSTKAAGRESSQLPRGRIAQAR